ncbi:hypothetical protein [Nocardioides sp. SYSU D00038]|uniref:hypothetical protein n=1 Tax=Nocardioides sp. SYSU D00038 TaxID=2812554 RepID=UPI0019681B1A|nr:hypothetical protein [Nocardioides sp. SYSU D00038]
MSTSPTPTLEVNRRLRLGRAWWAVPVVAVAVTAGWVATHPPALPLTQGPVTASAPAGESVFVGAFTPGSDFDRTLSISGIKLHATSSVELTLTPWLCRGGSVSVTVRPEAFCETMVNPEGQTLTRGDSIVVEATGAAEGAAVIDPVRIAYRDGLQWATQRAGAEITLRVLPR